jgi:ribose/xylose/arabinose/galactoside ABC-type transport system permease subunit
MADSVGPITRAATPRRVPVAIRFFQVFESLGVLLMLIIVLVVASLLAPGFFTVTNLTNLVITASITAVAGMGMTFAIAMGAFDLSVGSTQALTAIIAATLLAKANLPVPVAILGALLGGAIIGLCNGLIITRLRVPAFVATLGMMGVIRGVALLYTQGQSVMITTHREYALLNNGKILGIPIPFIVALLVLAGLYILLQHTGFGRHVCAVGGNEQAAVVSGLNVNRITVQVFMLVGMAAALSGVMLSSKLLIVDGTLGAGFELQAIAISVLGGTSLSGGTGNMVGTFIAALLLAAIGGALNILNVPSFYQYLALGLLLIFALAFDTLRRSLVSRAVSGAR